MSNHEDGGVVVPAERAEELNDVVTRLLVQVPGESIGKDQLGLLF